jgi:hypothetical protein
VSRFAAVGVTDVFGIINGSRIAGLFVGLSVFLGRVDVFGFTALLRFAFEVALPVVLCFAFIPGFRLAFAGAATLTDFCFVVSTALSSYPFIGVVFPLPASLHPRQLEVVTRVGFTVFGGIGACCAGALAADAMRNNAVEIEMRIMPGSGKSSHGGALDHTRAAALRSSLAEDRAVSYPFTALSN